MGRDGTYSLISVNAGDDEEIVIQTGVRRQAGYDRPEPANEVAEDDAAPAAETAAYGEPDAGDEAGGSRIGADEAPDGGNGSQPHSGKARYRETTQDDLNSVGPMSATQKAVIGCVLLFIVGFAVYYLFLR